MKTRPVICKHLALGTAVFAILSIILLISPPSKAQAPFADESILTTSESVVPPLQSIKDFSARTINNNVYLNLIMKGETANSVFLLEKSVDGSEFAVIAQKNGYPAPNGTSELLYSFTDPNPTPGKSYYRVRQFRKDGILYSHMATIFIEKEIQIVEKTIK